MTFCENELTLLGDNRKTSSPSDSALHLLSHLLQPHTDTQSRRHTHTNAHTVEVCPWCTERAALDPQPALCQLQQWNLPWTQNSFPHSLILLWSFGAVYSVPRWLEVRPISLQSIYKHSSYFTLPRIYHVSLQDCVGQAQHLVNEWQSPTARHLRTAAGCRGVNLAGSMLQCEYREPWSFALHGCFLCATLHWSNVHIPATGQAIPQSKHHRSLTKESCRIS